MDEPTSDNKFMHQGTWDITLDTCETINSISETKLCYPFVQKKNLKHKVIYLYTTTSYESNSEYILTSRVESKHYQISNVTNRERQKKNS
jgi:hypothetical protein